MTRPLPAQLADLLRIQRGILTTQQALQAGLTATMIRSRLLQGRWQRLYPGVYATFSGEAGREALLWAAVLSAGPGAMLSHQSAAELDGLADSPSPVIHVTIPRSRRILRRPGVAVHLSDRAELAVHPARLPPRTRIEETVLDLASTATCIDEAVGWIAKALGRRLTTQDRLCQALLARSRFRWRRQLAELLSPDMAGVLSALEYRYVRDVERPHGLPAGTRQAQARCNGRRVYRDVLYKAYQLIVELDGQLAHPAESRHNDSRRDNAAAADHGQTTLRYGWLDVTIRRCGTAAQVAAALARRGYTGARPCGPGCPLGRVRSERAERTGSAPVRNGRSGSPS